MDLPSEESLRWLVARYASLRAHHGEGIGEPHLVQPNGDDFPDPFEVSGHGVARFLAKVLEYAPVADDLDVRLRVLQEEGDGGGSCGTGGCGTGACGDKEARAKLRDRVIDAGDAYLVELPEGDAVHPVRLATTFARSAGTLVLLEAGETPLANEVGAMSEIAATACGFGVLLLSGAHVFGKSCGGVNVARHTHLSVEELGVLLALFTRLHGLKPGRARAYLEVTQVEAFGEALDWVDSNPRMMADLLDRPELLADGVFPVEEVKGVFSRWFGASRAKRPAIDEAMAVSQRKPRTADEQRRLDEARALVDAALGDGE